MLPTKGCHGPDAGKGAGEANHEVTELIGKPRIDERIARFEIRTDELREDFFDEIRRSAGC
jgi:hypothetical protein